MIRHVPGQWLWLMTTGKGLVQWSRLNDALMRKLLVGRGHDAETGRRFPPR